MRLIIAAVGKMREGAAKSVFDEYAWRLRWPLEVKEIDVGKRASPKEIQQLESERLLSCLPASALVVAMDERGKDLSSLEFSRKLSGWRDDGIADVAFLIGGADGHDEKLRHKANFLLRFGAMTWPHMLARAMLAEQLYRAQQIINGHPYHRE